ncbi:hypothetical protein FDECE_17110 [Fusarium decemcellulare]|nr:hypothetical protein FDECE_17110 [Fusarium decemcellulare]
MATSTTPSSDMLGPLTYEAAIALTVVLAAALYALYQYLLPKPIPGIPYNLEAARSLLGDIPTLQKSLSKSPSQWMIKEARRHASPVCQFFIIPFGKPAVLVADFREGQDILMRRKEFERSDFSIDILSGEVPRFHINLKTGPEWKAHRRLLQDLMTPKFLHNVAAPNIYKSATRLLDLWKIKARVAAGQPFSAEHDLFYATLDSVYDFGFGNDLAHRALIPQVERLQNLREGEVHYIRTRGREQDAIEFPIEKIYASTEAILESVDNITGVAATGFPKLAWWLKSLRPSTRRMRAVRDAFIKDEILKAVERLERENEMESEAHVRSAIDLIMHRERLFAGKEGRDPVYWSETMKDEILGFIAAGHDTASSTLCWGVKLITDNPSVQTRLRTALHLSYADAFVYDRLPTHEEITRTNVPYLDAFIEEMLRLAHTSLAQGRQCTQDTTILGHFIPKDTLVLVANKGPSFTEPGYVIKEDVRSKSCQSAAREHGVRAWSDEGMDEFRPERWLVKDEKTGEEIFDAAAGPTIPFGLGLRACYGRRLAYIELKLLVALLVWTFEFLPCPESLSGYEDIESLTRKPVQCFVNLNMAEI